MHLLRGALAPLLSGVLCGVLLLTVGPTESTAQAAGATASAAPAAAAAPGLVAKKKKQRYRVKEGITFNSPIGSRDKRRAILNKIMGAINHSRRGSAIRIMTWNFMSMEATNALLRAQKRGVKVRVLIDSSNNDADTPNPSFKRLKRELKANNRKKQKKKRRSFAKMCDHSCRGGGGAAHAKYYLFSQVGASKRVFMQGSVNLTAASANNQWNDVFTFVGRDKLYDFGVKIFEQAWKDRRAKSPYATVHAGRFDMTWSPYAGKKFKSDPVQDALDDVRCRGAVRSGNAYGRTIIRSAPDVIRGSRGMTAARRLKLLWDRGCDVRIVYTVMGKDVSRVLRAKSGRGPVPMRHLVQDFDGDGDFDNYFHMKVLTINGVLGNDKTTFLTFNGSSNTSDLATHSDENIGTIRAKGYTTKYQKHIEYWYNNKPSDGTENSGSSSAGGAAARKRVVDPYVNVDLD